MNDNPDARGASALRKARRIWGEAALDARRQIHARGLPVSGWLDDQAAGKRGAAVTGALARMAHELASAGLTPNEVALVASQVAGRIALAAIEVPPAA